MTYNCVFIYVPLKNDSLVVDQMNLLTYNLWRQVLLKSACLTYAKTQNYVSMYSRVI